MANRIKVRVLEKSYYITTDRTEAEMRVIERDLNEQLAAIQDSRPSLSTADMLVVLILNLMDRLSAGEESMDRMREQVAQYLEDATRVRIQLDTARQEVQRLTKELAKLR